MKDFLGYELTVGDEVALIDQDRGKLTTGFITNFTVRGYLDVTYRVNWESRAGFFESREQTVLKPEEIIKVQKS